MTPRLAFWSGVAALLAAAASAAGLWGLYRSETDRIPKFEMESVYFNEYSEANDVFIKFLRSNDGEKVFVNTVFDFSPFSFENYNMLNSCNNAYPRDGQSEKDFLATGGTFDILDGKIYNKPLHLPHHHLWDGKPTDDCSSNVEIVMDSKREVAPLSYGGTGVVRMAIRGNFVVHQSLSGAIETLTLREVDADEN